MIQIDMPMPEGCSECRFKTKREFCKAMPDNFCGNTNDEGRPEWCPLKEQEAVKPHYNPRSNWYECGACHYSMTSRIHYRNELIPAYKVGFCAKCGRPVKWE